MCRPFFMAGFLLAVLASLLPAEPDKKPERTLRQKTEGFDKDPGWDGHNNRVKVEKPNPVVQDFGYSKTNHAGGKAAGEVGGRVQRSTTSAFYGMRLDKPKTLDRKLRCSGSFAVTQSAGTSCLYFGWFNTKTPASRPYNWMGISLGGEKTGCCVNVGYRTASGLADGPGRITGYGPGWFAKPKVRDIHLIPNDGTRYTFDFLYDPEANGGTGEITVTLGGKGPFTGGPFTFQLPPSHRKSGATFDAFGIVNAQAAGGYLTAFFDDLVIDGQAESFDGDPKWVGQGNRDKLDDYGLEGAHQFGYSATALAGGKKGELGGLMYSSPSTPGYYGDTVGRLTLDDRLTASGKVALTQYGSDGGLYLGWFDSKKRGHPPANILGVLIDGTTSGGPRFRACAASSDPKAGHRQRDTAALIAPDGKSHTWKIEYDPGADDGRGRLTVWLDDQKDSFTLPPELRKAGATFDRFGLFVHEGGGRASRIYLDDLEYTASGDTDSSSRTLEGHTSSVMALAFSFDGKVLVSSSRDKSIKFWDMRTGKVERTLSEHADGVYTVGFSPKGDMLASGSGDKTVKLRDAATGKVIRTLEGHTDIVRSVAFSPDGKLLASVSVDKTVRLWDVKTGELLKTLNGHTARVKSVVYSPDGKWIATAASDKTIRVWDTQTGEEKAKLEGHTGDIETLALSPDGKLLASSSNDTTIRIWDTTPRKTVRTLQGHAAEVDSVDFSPDGKTVASGSKDKTIKLWDARRGKLLRTLTGHTGRVESLAFSPDGKTLATGGGGGDTSLKLWDLTQE